MGGHDESVSRVDPDYVDWSDRFWSKACPEALSGCWLWSSTNDPLMNPTAYYGRFYINGRYVRAHRHAWELVNGPIPAAPGRGLFVCHRCDVPACINPRHLFLGTPLDNVADMDAKGRRRAVSHPQLRGEQAVNVRLKEPQVLEIVALAHGGMTRHALGLRFGVSTGTIANILDGKNWNWLTSSALASLPPPKRRLLSDADIADMRTRRLAGERVTAIAVDYGVTQSAVSHALRRRAVHDSTMTSIATLGECAS